MRVQTPSSPFNAPTPAPLRMSFPEYLDWLDEDKHAEWVDGEVIMHRPVSYRHNDVSGFLISVLRPFIQKRGLGRMSFEPYQMKTGPQLPSRSPDIVFVATENLHRMTRNLLEGPADLAIEIISPESRGRDHGDKFYEYEEGGVREYWIIDPERQQAEFYWLGPNRRYAPALPDSSGRYYSSVLPGLFVEVAWLWQEVMPLPEDILTLWV